MVGTAKRVRAASHRAIDKANLVIAVGAHSGAARGERTSADQERLAAGAIGGGATSQEPHSANIKQR